MHFLSAGGQLVVRDRVVWEGARKVQLNRVTTVVQGLRYVCNLTSRAMCQSLTRFLSRVRALIRHIHILIYNLTHSKITQAGWLPRMVALDMMNLAGRMASSTPLSV